MVLDELRTKAARRWPDYLRTVALAAVPDAGHATDPLFPWTLPLPRPVGEAALGKAIEQLRNQLRPNERRGDEPGYTLRTEKINTRTAYGSQTIATGLIFPTSADWLQFLGPAKQLEAATFAHIVANTRDKLPTLLPWLADHAPAALAHAADWPRLLRVCAYFLSRPASASASLYLRELPIEGVDTKFIEQRKGILRQLLDVVLPPESLNYAATSFLGRFGLREPEKTLVRLRILDPDLSATLPWQLDDFSVPLSKFCELTPPGDVVLIVENLTVFLTLPPIRGAVAVFGQGAAVGAVRAAGWLGQRRLLYWGDLDSHGLRILATVRANWPHAEALLMDEATFRRYPKLHVSAKPINSSELPQLPATEQALFQHLASTNRSLEQERIPSADVQLALRAAGLGWH